MSQPTLGLTGSDKPVHLDIDRLVASRLLLQANSGAGKSWALRRILEQTHGLIQHLVIDLEGEFYTLREKFDYVLAAARRDGDCPADPRSAPLLARRLLELGVSAILDIYELKYHDRIRFVRLFLESLIDAPRDLWHPVLVVVDEAHVFCPQKGDAESAAAVIDLQTRGRKRGFVGLLATQRLSKLHKDAAAECNNKLIGRSSLDVDMKRAGDELGFSMREDILSLRALADGEFYAFGPAISPEVEKIKVGPVETTHPKAGQRSAPPAPAREKVSSILAKLSDLPREAAEGARSSTELRARVKELERELRARPRQEVERTKEVRVEVPALKERDVARLEKLTGRIQRLGDALVARAEMLRLIPQDVRKLARGLDRPFQAPGLLPPPSPARRPALPPARPDSNGGRHAQTTRGPCEGMTGPEQRILDAIAWMESIGVPEPELSAAAFLAGYVTGGGAFNNPKGALRRKDLVEYVAVGRIRLTEAGRGNANAPAAPLTKEEMQRRVMERLGGPERRILDPLLAAYPEGMTFQDLAAASGYGAGGGAFNNPRGRLRTLGLIEYPTPGLARARGILFLE